MELPKHFLPAAIDIKQSLQNYTWEERILILTYMLELAKKKAEKK